MKNFVFLFCFSILSIHSYSQNSFKPAEFNMDWSGINYSLYNGCCPLSYAGFWTKVYADSVGFDTLIGTHSYTALYMTNNDIDSVFYCAFRSDTLDNSIYIMPKDSTSEYLYFDFDAPHAIGDTLSIPLVNFNNDFFDWEFELVDFVLTGTNLFNFDGLNFNNWEFSNELDLGGVMNLNVSERLISNSGFPFTYSAVSNLELYYRDLKCYSEDNTVLYSLSNICPFDLDAYNVFRSLNNEIELIEASVYPNPSNGEFMIESIENINSIAIYSLDGKVIQFNAVVNKNKATVNLSEVYSGAVILTIATDNGVIHKKMVLK